MDAEIFAAMMDSQDSSYMIVQKKVEKLCEEGMYQQMMEGTVQGTSAEKEEEYTPQMFCNMFDSNITIDKMRSYQNDSFAEVSGFHIDENVSDFSAVELRSETSECSGITELEQDYEQSRGAISDSICKKLDADIKRIGNRPHCARCQKNICRQHVAKPGDTLSLLATSYQAGVMKLLAWNEHELAGMLRQDLVLREDAELEAGVKYIVSIYCTDCGWDCAPIPNS